MPDDTQAHLDRLNDEVGAASRALRKIKRDRDAVRKAIDAGKDPQAPAKEDAITEREALRSAVRYFYDLQRIRIAVNNRVIRQPEYDDAVLEEKHRKFFALDAELVGELERNALRVIKSLIIRSPVYPWLESVKGCGPTLSGVILSEFDINIAVRPSQFWAFAGLHVEDGHTPKPKRGEKLNWNRWLRSKLLKVLGDCLLKAGNETYRPIYDGYKDRLRNRIGPCSCCVGTGEAKDADSGKKKPCWNCDGGKLAGRAPWGKSDAHRHQASIRYMVKMFVLDLWKAWREAEGLPVVPPYHEAKLGITHAA